MMNGRRPWPALLAIVLATAVFVWAGATQLDAPTTPAKTGFEQARAFETLSRLLVEQQPHVAGSLQNAAVRLRVVAELKAYGYEPTLQTALQCGPPDRFAGCTQVANIIAIRKGARPGKALLVTAHYDSVAAGPGAGDDGAGMAVVLEFARAIARRTTKNDVIFLISDGEETGLRGAIAFARRHPLMKQVGLVLNFEARGASGPSLMFETGPGNARLIDVFAQAVPAPYANSLLYEIYRLMPNDTDFTVYRRAGLNGFNFAFTGSGSLYHSERDNLANLDRRTLQHHGDNLFALGFALADADLDALRTIADASYFDLFGQTMIVWPASLNLPLALAAFLAIVMLIVAHRAVFTLRATALVVATVVAAPLMLFAAGWVLSFPLGIWPGVHPIDHPAPWPARVALVSAALSVAFLASSVFCRLDPRAGTLVVALVVAFIGAGLAWFVTGASYLFVIPAVVFAAVAWIEMALRRDIEAAAWVMVLALAFFWLTLWPRLDLVLGFHLSGPKLLALAPFVWALALVVSIYLRGGIKLPLSLAVASTIAAALVATQVPTFTENRPRGLNVVYLDDRTAKPRWLIDFVGGTDEAYLDRVGFAPRAQPYLRAGLFESEGYLKPATDVQLEAPTFTLHAIDIAGGLRVARGTIRPGRGGIQLAFGLAAGSGVRAIRVAGQELAGSARLSRPEPTLAVVSGWGPRELPVEITYDAGAARSLLLIERSALPKSGEAQALLAARPRNAAPTGIGNATVVIVPIALPGA